METKVQPGSHQADEKYGITVTEDGPYMVYGNPPMDQQFITKDEEGFSWTFEAGQAYDMDAEPVALCRCGASQDKPYCDGSHITAQWDPRCTASEEPLLSGAELYPGPVMSLSDNQEYCVFARFCDAKGRVWNLVGQTDDAQKKDYMVHEANMCPNGRLSAWDNATKQPIEPRYEPSMALIEDRPMALSGGIWVKGGIPVKRPDGFTYEIRNRVVLCRCGQSSNKPLCDGTHASMRFRDGLPDNPPGK
ncbi:MAG: CDGSH iron-sulfur domain-containing protein [Rikenellaceae bacterium]|nr:CDGSH iron-sulfur domain-containing protein [Rikenellaceae bacterium]